MSGQYEPTKAADVGVRVPEGDLFEHGATSTDGTKFVLMKRDDLIAITTDLREQREQKVKMEGKLEELQNMAVDTKQAVSSITTALMNKFGLSVEEEGQTDDEEYEEDEGGGDDEGEQEQLQGQLHTLALRAKPAPPPKKQRLDVKTGSGVLNRQSIGGEAAVGERRAEYGGGDGRGRPVERRGGARRGGLFSGSRGRGGGVGEKNGGRRDGGSSNGGRGGGGGGGRRGVAVGGGTALMGDAGETTVRQRASSFGSNDSAPLDVLTIDDDQASASTHTRRNGGTKKKEAKADAKTKEKKARRLQMEKEKAGKEEKTKSKRIVTQHPSGNGCVVTWQLNSLGYIGLSSAELDLKVQQLLRITSKLTTNKLQKLWEADASGDNPGAVTEMAVGLVNHIAMTQLADLAQEGPVVLQREVPDTWDEDESEEEFIGRMPEPIKTAVRVVVAKCFVGTEDIATRKELLEEVVTNIKPYLEVIQKGQPFV